MTRRVWDLIGKQSSKDFEAFPFFIIQLIQFNQMNDYERAKSDFPINASLDRVFVA
jgi:hypothetical protein